MYTLLDSNSMWSMPHGSTMQGYPPGYYGGMPTFVFAAPPTINQSNQQMYYQIQPAIYAPMRPNNQFRPQHYPDGVFIPEGAFQYNAPAQTQKASTHQNDCPSKASSCGSQPSSNSSSPNSINGSSSGYITSSESVPNPRKLNTTLDSLSVTTNSNSSSSSGSNKNDDSFIHQLFPVSLCAAINEDPPEPTAGDAPLKTSSPIHNEKETKSLLIDFSNLRKRRGREMTSSTSDKCPRFSDNGVCNDLDECDKILIRLRAPDIVDEEAKKREEFLLILEAERGRQRKLVLPRNSTKMSCKFCRNNGESADVYTKHRLHYNEKTVCPILRHYVCRLCNSTGDFAHTIRHCPFNDRKDTIAYRATFLS